MKKIIGILLTVVVLVGLTSTTALAWTAPTLTGGKAEWNVQISDAGMLTWNDMGSTTYDIEVDETAMGVTLTKIYGINTNSYNLINRLRELKVENGTYYFTIKAIDLDTTSGTISFNYVSPEPKLSEPQNLYWDGTTAKWDSVDGATGYEVKLYRDSGSLQLSKTTSEIQYDWNTNVYNDGFWFEVVATADGYRDSNSAEGPKYGTYSWTAPTLTGGKAEWNVQLSDGGMLRWNDMGSTSYDIDVDETAMGGTVTKIYSINTNAFNLINRFKELKIENGIYYFTIKANDQGTTSGDISFRYVSPEPKLSAPQNLYWDGTIAKWDSVAGATGYEVKLYRDSGSLQLSKTTSETQYDWSTNVYNDGFWFEVVATADGYRDSNSAESPKYGASISSTVYNIGAYVYDDTLDTNDSGGQVILTTDKGTDGWSDSGYIKEATEGTIVTLNAEPAAGYKFIEWRQGTGGATISTYANYAFIANEHKYLYAIFEQITPPQTTNTIESVSFTTNPPKELESYWFVTPVDDSYSVDYAYWFESDTGADGTWNEMTQTDTFKVGKYYKVEVDIIVEDGYQFLLDSDLDPIVSATMNGYYAEVVKTYDQDPSKCITVCYNFGMCNDSVIEDIRIVSVAKPVAGEHPQYVCNLLGSGYELYEMTDLWYRINSIEWTDVTNGGTLLGEDDVFVPGHTYQFLVYLHAQDGYNFHVTGGNDAPATNATVNGNVANIKETSNASKYQTITYEFTCEQKEISTIMIYNLDKPQASMMPDTAVTTAYPEYYVISNTNGFDYIHWYGNFADDGSFLPGEKYQVELKVVPTQINGVVASKFVKPITGLINGEEVTEADTGFDSNDGVLVSTSAVYIFYTYTVEEAQDTVTVLDKYKNSFDLDGKAVVEVKLPTGNGQKKITVGGAELYYNADRELYVGIVDESSISGDTLTGAVVEDTAPTQFVYGNVNNDANGAINNGDLLQLKLFMQSKTSFEYVNLLSADVNADGRINNGDLLQLKLYMQKGQTFGALSK